MRFDFTLISPFMPLSVAMQFYLDPLIADAVSARRYVWCSETADELSQQCYSLCENYLLLQKQDYSDAGGVGKYIRQHIL
jgi:hypothetical protein